jgi:hypothetical protein
MYTAEMLLTAYRRLPAEERRRFEQAIHRELADRLAHFMACLRARLDRVDRRNAAVAQLIANKQLPTVTLEDWRNISATLQAAEPELAYQHKNRADLGDAPLTGPRAARPIQARNLRASYRKWSKKARPARRAAA